MKRGIFIFLIVGFVILLGTNLIYIFIWKTNVDNVTGEVITGEATQGNLAITIAIIGGPSLTILNPENKIYLNNESLLLNFTAAGEETVWYNFDNAANTTITSSILFNISQGSHTLYMFANNTDGNETAKNVTFTTDSTKFIISYNEFADSNKGESTDFNASTYEDIQNLANIILENTKYGKISFNDTINVTNDEDASDNKVDLDTYVNISQNRIELNSSALPNFNKSATLYLYNLTFSNPRVLRDDVICPSSICTFQSYSGGNLTFNVTGFTVYTAEETPAAEAEASSEAGGGGGGLTFTISLDEIIISLKQGEIKTRNITIKNEIDTKISFSVSSDIGEFVKISEENFELKAKEEKTISIDFIAKENTLPELYLGNLFIEAGNEKRKIQITIEIESADALFDIKVEISEQFRIIKPGEVLPVSVNIFNIKGPDEPVDVKITYQIRDFNNEILLENKDAFTVKGKKNFIRNFKIPNNAKEGKYILYAPIVYQEKIASSTAQFVIGTSLIRNTLVFLFIIILMIIVAILYNTEKYFIRHLTRKNINPFHKKKKS